MLSTHDHTKLEGVATAFADVAIERADADAGFLRQHLAADRTPIAAHGLNQVEKALGSGHGYSPAGMRCYIMPYFGSGCEFRVLAGR